MSSKRSRLLVPNILVDGFERDIQESCIYARAPEVLEALLVDRTMTAVDPEYRVHHAALYDWTAAGLPRPKLEETPGFFKVVFERKKKSNETINETISETINETVNETIKSTLISLIASNPGVGGVALVKLVGKSRATVMRELAALKQQELIVYCGSKRTGGYFLAASAQKEAK